TTLETTPEEPEGHDQERPRAATAVGAGAGAAVGAGAGASTAVDEDFAQVALCSPFSDLISRLYKLHGHTPPKVEKQIVPFPSTTIQELYNLASGILTDWDNQTKVALSGIVNTIDSSNGQYFSNFEAIRDGCHIADFFTVTSQQQAIINKIKSQLGSGKRRNLSRLRRYCSRRYDDLDEQQDLGSWAEEQEDAFEEELSIMKIMVLICNEIEAMATRQSETEDVVIWRDIARILFSGEMTPRIGELGSQCTRDDRVKVEEVFGGSESHIKSRKIDLFFQKQLPGFSKPLELFSWEAKSMSAGTEQLQIQRRKNIRINACIANKTSSIAGFVGSVTKFPLPDPVILDIEGKEHCRVFGAGTVTASKSMICLPGVVDSIEDFLDEGHLSALLSLKHHNIDFVKAVKKGATLYKDEEALSRMLGHKMTNSEPCIIYTPTKKTKKDAAGGKGSAQQDKKTLKMKEE
ncbi:hypothetical protein BGZ95_006190, partial [Linnemannia exigua]